MPWNGTGRCLSQVSETSLWESGIGVRELHFFNLCVCSMFEKVLQKCNVFLIGIFFMPIFSAIILAMANDCAF